MARAGGASPDAAPGPADTDDRPAGRRQARWRFTTPAVLLLLQAGPAHGYDLLTRLPSVLPRATDPPDPGTFYRLLRGIEADGAITSSWQAPQAGPARKVYTLTDTGREQLDWWALQIERDLEALHRFRTAYRTATAPDRIIPDTTRNPEPPTG
jgi:PadR family transcriptional regulator, regulatory protein PadR